MPLFMAISAGVGALKHYAIDVPAAGRKRQLASETDRYSPWTGMHGGQVNDPNLAGTMLSTGATGAMLKQGMDNSNSNSDFSKALQGIMLANYSGAGMPGPAQPGTGTQGPQFGWNGGSMMPDQYNSPWFGKIGG